jgi:unsaturated rhamnogalacturonyl hydrolase
MINSFSCRTVLLGGADLVAGAILPGQALAAPVDWSRAVIDSTMIRDTSASLGCWD